jgi:hypothetical protein
MLEARLATMHNWGWGGGMFLGPLMIVGPVLLIGLLVLLTTGLTSRRKDSAR